MCLGIPGKVTKTYREHDVLMGKVDFSGIVKQVCLEHVPQVQPGQYVLVHVGFALSMIDEEEASQVFQFLDRMNQLDEIQQPDELEPREQFKPPDERKPPDAVEQPEEVERSEKLKTEAAT